VVLRLEAEIAHPDGPLAVRLAPGEVEVVAGERATVLIGGLLGHAPGDVLVDGRRMGRRGVAGRARRGLVLVGDAPVAPGVPIVDHLAAVTSTATARHLLEEAPLLAGRGDEPAGILSGGERRVLAWLRALALEPVAVVLDRAGRGLDDGTLAWATGVVRRWRYEGVAIVLRPGRDEELRWVDAEA
jgi:ABC-type branched-subunit amino acid transport system ATPase component